MTLSISLRASPKAGGCTKIGNPNVASVTNTSHGIGTNGAQVGSGARL